MSSLITAPTKRIDLTEPQVLLRVATFLSPISLTFVPRLSTTIRKLFSDHEHSVYQDALLYSFKPLLSVMWPDASPNASPKLYFLNLMTSIIREELCGHTELQLLRCAEEEVRGCVTYM